MLRLAEERCVGVRLGMIRGQVTVWRLVVDANLGAWAQFRRSGWFLNVESGFDGKELLEDAEWLCGCCETFEFRALAPVCEERMIL